MLKYWINLWRQAESTWRPYRKRLGVIWDALSMRAKLSLLFTGLIVVMTTFFYIFAVYQTTREIKIGAIYKGQAIAEALKTDTLYTLQTRNFPNLSSTFRRLASSRNDIAYVFLLDPSGQVLAHSEADQVNRVISDRLTKKDLATSSTRVDFRQVDLEGQGNYDELCDVSVPIFLHGRREATLRVGISLTQYLLANGPRIRSKIALFALPLAFLSILIAIRLASSFTWPLQRLAQAASEISHGNYDVQMPLNRRDELGEVAHAFNVMASHLKENFSKVSDMANRDGLTGLYNARFFQEALSRELERVKRTGRNLSLILFDADRFKRVNDHYGHPMGDQVLQHISRIGRSVLRGYDVLARYGGEEFIALLTDTNSSQAMLLGERLRKIVEQRPFVTEEGEVIKVTVSVGVAQARVPFDPKEVISQADQALYRAKETGRNRVILYKSSLFESPAEPHLPFQNELIR
jgi:diguanylate cyclase (GGDEF)-like protein